MSDDMMCPGEQSLRDLVEGRIGEARLRPLQTHLEACPSCHRLYDAIKDASRIDETEASSAGARTAMRTTLTALPLSDLDGWPAFDPDPDAAPDPVQDRDDDEEFDLSFLSPSNRARSWGRIGRYEVLGKLGRGGMGVVLKAIDPRLNRLVAIKVLAPRLASSAKARRRFLREARSAASISHSNVVIIHGASVHRGTPYLVMELVPGCTLRQHIRKNGSLSPSDTLRISAQIAQGLAAAHAQGVIHRDINPSNIMLEQGIERVKITDFGLARAAMDLSDITSRDRVVGTPAYMAPEQVKGEAVDTRSDLFGLGCAMYAMLTGASPFRGAHTIDVIRRVSDHHPTPPIDLVPDCPQALSDIVMKLLAKDPADRFATADEVLRALQPLLEAANQADSTEGASPVLARPDPLTRPQPLVAPKPQSEGFFRRSLHWKSWNDGEFPWTTVAAMTLLLAAFALFLLLRRKPDHPTPPNPLPAVLTVARSGRAHFNGIGRALQQARPGDTIRILDNATYEGMVLFNNPRRWRDITIEAPRGASLFSRTGGAVIQIQNTPGIVLRGLTIRPGRNQHSVLIVGNAEGVILDRLQSIKTPESTWAHVWITEGAAGSSRRPIVIRDSRFESGGQGVILQGDSERAVAFVRVEGNTFSDLSQHVELLNTLRDVKVMGNIFQYGQNALWLNLPAACSQRIVIANNSFFQVTHWLHPAESDPDQEECVIRNNAIFGSSAIDTADALLTRMARTWRFDHNLWETEEGPKTGPLARRVPRLEVLSRDPSNPDFLRPAPGSTLLESVQDGDDSEVVGAKPPALRHDQVPPSTQP